MRRFSRRTAARRRARARGRPLLRPPGRRTRRRCPVRRRPRYLRRCQQLLGRPRGRRVWGGCRLCVRFVCIGPRPPSRRVVARRSHVRAGMLRLASVDRVRARNPHGILCRSLRLRPSPQNCANLRHLRPMTMRRLPSRPSDPRSMGLHTKRSYTWSTTCRRAKPPPLSHRPSSSRKTQPFGYPTRVLRTSGRMKTRKTK